jgi:hypothetical protein
MKEKKKYAYISILALMTLTLTVTSCNDGINLTHSYENGTWHTVKLAICIEDSLNELRFTRCNKLKDKETTAEPNANLFFDGTGNTPIFSSDWDY